MSRLPFLLGCVQAAASWGARVPPLRRWGVRVPAHPGEGARRSKVRSLSPKEGPAQPRQPQEEALRSSRGGSGGQATPSLRGGDVLASRTQPRPQATAAERAPASRSQGAPSSPPPPGSAGYGDSVGIHRVGIHRGGKPRRRFGANRGAPGLGEDLCSTPRHAHPSRHQLRVRARPLG